MGDGFDDDHFWPWGKRGFYRRIIEWPEATIRLIDALRLYLDVDERDYEDFKDEIEISEEQLRKVQAKLGVMKAILKELENSELDPTLEGLRKVKHG